MTTSRRKSGRAALDALEQAKLDALKELAYGASHEINNPLANISARAQTLLRDEADPERRRALEAIHQQALRAHEMIADLMLFARPPRLERAAVNARKVVDKVVTELGPECARREIEIEALGGEDVPAILADEVQLAVAVKALCTNSMEAIGRGGRIRVRIGAADGKTLRIEVSDNGPGVAAEVREHIFDPFFSGREAGRGLGFGLSKCWRIVTEHGGRVTVGDGAERGAVFIIELPLGSEA
jgi:signal transduction histidine kinase